MITGLRLLIVDDMPQVRAGLRTILPLAGVALAFPVEIVGEAGDGQEALQQVEALQPDVVLMDLEMPGMDGYTATQNIKTRHPDTPVVALTVHGDPASRMKAGEAGADLFIEKGVPVTEIIRAIQKFEKKDQ
jgi:DNA-binding NarL/FixJ family response regulator